MRARLVPSRVALCALVTLALAAALAAALARPAAATSPGTLVQLGQAYAGTAKYLDVGRAVADGYGEFRDAAGIACIDKPGVGGMGIHYVGGGVADIELDPATPEALVYEPDPHGRLRLVAVEYIVFQEAWDKVHKAPPSMFGQTFTLVPGGPLPDGNRYGIPAFYELHAWLWKWNPRGLFDDWNPRVTCHFAAA